MVNRIIQSHEGGMCVESEGYPQGNLRKLEADHQEWSAQATRRSLVDLLGLSARIHQVGG